MAARQRETYDRESLIEFCREHEELYMVQHPLYGNKEHCDGLFQEAALKVGLKDAYEAKLKWKSLKDSYRLQKKKMFNSRMSKDYPSKDVKWPYFTMLSFLDPFINVGRNGGGCCPEESGEPREPFDEVRVEVVPEQSSPEDSPARHSSSLSSCALQSKETGSYSCCRKRVRKRSKEETEDQGLAPDERMDIRPRRLGRRLGKQDEEYYFGQSVAARLRKFNEKQKQIARYEIEKILFEVGYSEDRHIPE